MHFIGESAATAESIFTAMDKMLKTSSIPWANCVGVSVDNTSVNLGKRNSIMTRACNKNSSIHFMGCPCHIIHNMAVKASESSTKVSSYDNNYLAYK